MRRIAPALLLLTACGGPRAGTQAGDMARLHAYEVAPEQVAQAARQGYIEVSGTGSVEVEVDRASVSFAVETLRPTAAEAAAINAEVMESVLAAIRGGGFSGLDVETFGYSLSPQYQRGANDASAISGFLASNGVRAYTDDVQDVGRLIDDAAGAGANRVHGLAFSVADTREAREAALTLAVRDARAKAEVIAAALGRSLGPALEVHDGAQPDYPGQMRLRVAEFAATPIEPGDQTVSASVTVKFALGPERAPR